MAEAHGWQWGLGMEYLNYSINCGEKFEVLDASFVGELNLKVLLRRFFGYKVRRASLKFIKSKSVKVIRSSFVSINFINVIDYELLTKSAAYNSVVDYFKSTNWEAIRKEKSHRRVIKAEMRKSKSIQSKLMVLDLCKYEKIVTVNGRFTKSATIVRFCKNNNLKYELIEGGGHKRSSFQIFEESPHSSNEVHKKITDLWNSSKDPERTAEAEKFLVELTEKRELPGINFRTNIKYNQIPEFGGKKICVYFASSEFEWVGVADEIPKNQFQNQTEALRALIQNLNPNAWDVYLRAHPDLPNSKILDPDAWLWQEFLKLPNFYYIPSYSTIDSIALGIRANLIASFGSTINIEFLARGLNNVLTMGPSTWNALIPERFAPTNEDIKKFINSELAEIDKTKLLPWAYYQINAGIPFALLETSVKTGEWKFRV